MVVAILFGLTVYAQNGFTSLSAHPAVTVEVEGFQWQWQFRYPDDGVTVTGTDQANAALVLPVGETIRFHLVSDDVNHSFWVPEFLEKRDLIPGVNNEIDVTITATGRMDGTLRRVLRTRSLADEVRRHRGAARAVHGLDQPGTTAPATGDHR